MSSEVLYELIDKKSGGVVTTIKSDNINTAITALILRKRMKREIFNELYQVRKRT